LTYRAALLTVRISGATPPVRSSLMPFVRRSGAGVGATVAAFHAAGICHADLNAHNILIDPNDSGAPDRF
jgi:3-deoxy-D-manno-octulosonic acid kinase